MNIYEKLMEARLNFHQAEMKKSGWNDYGKYNYFELADIVVPGLQILAQFGLCPVVCFDKEMATLTLINAEKPDERIVFTSPQGGAQLKATHEIQQIGAVETYQRRYLYAMLWDLVEHDAIDALPPIEDTPFTRMEACKTLDDLQTVFATEYSAGSKADKVKIKKHYDQLKATFVVTEGPADA